MKTQKNKLDEGGEELKFERAIEQLEKIVEFLEGGNAPLDEALKKYEEGVGLARYCSEKLAQAEKKIEILTRQLDGTLKPMAFDVEQFESEETGKKEKPFRKETPGKAGGEEEETLF